MSILEIVGMILVAAGIVLAATAAIGLVRFPDVLSRMHAASKPQTVSLILLMAGVALIVRSWAIAGMLSVVVAAQLLTITASGAMLGRAAFRRGFIHGGEYALDELSPRLASTGEGDDDEDGFIDEDPSATGEIDLSERVPSNTLAATAGLELAELKQYWDEEEDDGSAAAHGVEAHPRTGEFQGMDEE